MPKLRSRCPNCNDLADGLHTTACPKCGHPEREAVFVGRACRLKNCPSGYHHPSGVHFWSFDEEQRIRDEDSRFGPRKGD